MITITVVASSLLVTAFGVIVARSSTEALIDAAGRDAEQKLLNGVAWTRSQLPAGPITAEDPDTSRFLLRDVLSYLASPRDQGGGVIVAVRAAHEPAIEGDLVWPYEVTAADAITPELERDVADAHKIAHQIVTVDLGSPEAPGPQTYMVIGSPVPTRWKGGQIELYYLFPMQSQIESAERIRTTVAGVGIILVILLAVVVALVTRLVLNPVRMAARTAQRLSAGLLDQRMVVRWEDELSVLADAFNQMADSLQRQIVRLEEMSRLQRRFTSDVSHELRTPLTTVRMAADLLHASRDEFDPAAARSAELLQTELDRFEDLLTELLEISRFDAGFAVLDAEPADLVGLVRRVAARLEPVAERVGVELVVAAPDEPVVAEIDPRRVERILRNLVDNAIDHGQGKPVVVTVAADDRAVAVTVRDHGLGLKPGEEQLVFNRFWRADPSRARQTGGTGLGLSISAEDARLHGGVLEAWGAPGQGAQFRLTLPLEAGGRLKGSPLPLAPAVPPKPRSGPEPSAKEVTR